MRKETLSALLLLTTLFLGCQKDHGFSSFENRAGSVLQNKSAAERDEGSFCIIYESSFGSTLDPICFTESELTKVLENAGVSTTQVATYTQVIFHSDAATGALIHEVGGYIADGCDCVPWYALLNSYIVYIHTSGNFAPSGPIGSEYTCPPAVITTINIACSKDLGNGTVSGGAYQLMRLHNICNGDNIDFSCQHPDVYNALIASGLTIAETNQTLNNFANGLMTEREVWNLFQFRVLPNLPAYQQFVQQNGGIQLTARCWKLVRIDYAKGIDPDISYYAANLQGYANLYCGPFD